MEKEIRIFDSSNKVLKVKGIRFRLLEVNTGTLLDYKDSDDLKPGAPGGSNEWGVKLSFSPKSGPLEVFTNDPTHRYPGNTIQSLEGQNNNRIDVDLSKVPATSGGQGGPISTTNPKAFSHWVASATKWSPDEKRAVVNLVSNYTRLIGYREVATNKDELNKIAEEWETVLKNLGIQT